MENFKQIIILSTKTYQGNIFLLQKQCKIIDDAHLEVDNHIYSFDYLIFDDPKLIQNFNEINFLVENNLPVTNFFLQTSIENIYFTENKIEEALNNILENE